MSYTKGDWHVATLTETGFDTLVIGGDDGVVADTHMSWRSYTENEANAQLISASPNMLQALKACEVSLIEDEYYQHFKPLLKTIKEAIKKAEGK